jgi:hypothetical protein
MSPPFRNKKHQDSLWAGLQAGSLSVVATDHCAFTTEQKRYGVGDFTKIPNGTGGLEDRMPMLWTHGVETGRLTMNEFVAVTSTNIAKILNCYPKKGAILWARCRYRGLGPGEGKDDHRRTQQSAIDYNVFEGKEVKGLPRFTLTRGQVAVHDGEVRTQEGPRQVRQARREPNGGEQGAVDLEGADRAAPGGAHGHSGDGLRVIAALEHPTGGTLTVNGMTPDEARLNRAYGYVFQAAGALPVAHDRKNITLPLEIMGFDRAEQASAP